MRTRRIVHPDIAFIRASVLLKPIHPVQDICIGWPRMPAMPHMRLAEGGPFSRDVQNRPSMITKEGIGPW